MERWYTITNSGIFNISEILYVIKLYDNTIRFMFKNGNHLDLTVKEDNGVDDILKDIGTLFEE